jgi:hypothetical protein
MGRPRGAWGEKAFRDALQRAVRKRAEKNGEHKGAQLLDVIAERTVEAAVAGESWAVREIGDRLDGKPNQSIDSHVVVDLGIAHLEALRALTTRPQRAPVVIDVPATCTTAH